MPNMREKKRGKKEGKLETEARLLPVIEAKDNQLSEKDKRIAELEAMLAEATAE